VGALQAGCECGYDLTNGRFERAVLALELALEVIAERLGKR
jgi:hypothetical protein